MALVVEDGTGLSGANAYVDVAFVTTYLSLRGDADWADLDTVDQEAAIVRATYALDYQYRDAWKGIRKTATQARAWPRIKTKDDLTTLLVDDEGYDIANDTVPVAVQNACAEVAKIETTQRFITQEITRDDMVKVEKIGPLTTEWFEGTPATSVFPHIDGILDTVTSSSGSGSQVEILLTAEEANQGESVDVFDYPNYFNIVKYP
jgi:hypothetical protein